uniref:Uncharacterized protein n=1 Tax=Anopheles dirus TaxID=7168 RepID=A0A182NYZ0_9DIPT
MYAKHHGTLQSTQLEKKQTPLLRSVNWTKSQTRLLHHASTGYTIFQLEDQ